MKPRRFLAAGLLVAGALAGIIWAVGSRNPGPIPDRAEGTLRIASYNIRAALGGLDAVTEDLRRLDPDLVALQEVERGIARSRSQDQAGHLGRDLGLNWAFAGSFEVDGGEHGIAVLSRYPILQEEIVRLPQGTGRWPRVALKVRVDAPGGPLTFVCVHLARPWGWPLSNLGARLEQMDALLESLEGVEGPVIVAGDFNSLPISWEAWKMAHRLQAAWNPWRDGWANSFPLESIGWPRGAVQIDHVFHDADWQSRGFWAGSLSASDHRPVVADLVRLPE